MVDSRRLGDYLYAAIPTLPPNNPALHKAIDPSRPATCSWHTCAAIPDRVIRIDWPDVPTQQQRDEVDAALAAFVVPTQTQIERTDAKRLVLTDTTAAAKAYRAVAGVMVDEINSLRQWITSLKAAVAAATNLADLKTRVANLADVPDRTMAQAKTAIGNKLDSGGAD